MKTRVLTLVLTGALGFSSLAMAADLGSSDSDFLFGKDQVKATTISNQEMANTQGQLLTLSGGAKAKISGSISTGVDTGIFSAKTNTKVKASANTKYNIKF